MILKVIALCFLEEKMNAGPSVEGFETIQQTMKDGRTYIKSTVN